MGAVRSCWDRLTPALFLQGRNEVVLRGRWSSLTTILLRRCPARRSSDFKHCAGDFKRHRKVIVDDLFGYRPVVTGAAREVLNASVAYESLEESSQRYTV